MNSKIMPFIGAVLVVAAGALGFWAGYYVGMDSVSRYSAQSLNPTQIVVLDRKTGNTRIEGPFAERLRQCEEKAKGWFDIAQQATRERDRTQNDLGLAQRQLHIYEVLLLMEEGYLKADGSWTAKARSQMKNRLDQLLFIAGQPIELRDSRLKRLGVDPRSLKGEGQLGKLIARVSDPVASTRAGKNDQ